MAAKNVKRHEKLNAPESPAGRTEVSVDEWVPDYDRRCEICGEAPCAKGLREGTVVYEPVMCGACLWRDAVCINPANW